VLDRDAIEIEEYQCRGESRALVAIIERLILGNVKQIRGRHFMEILVQVLASKRRLWLRQR